MSFATEVGQLEEHDIAYNIAVAPSLETTKARPLSLVSCRSGETGGETDLVPVTVAGPWAPLPGSG